ncbi:hypothetical protein STEG23_001249, partial [Scotinomys teguina]
CQKRALDSLELEFWMVPNHHVGAGNRTQVSMLHHKKGEQRSAHRFASPRKTGQRAEPAVNTICIEKHDGDYCGSNTTLGFKPVFLIIEVEALIRHIAENGHVPPPCRHYNLDLVNMNYLGPL